MVGVGGFNAKLSGMGAGIQHALEAQLGIR